VRYLSAPYSIEDQEYARNRNLQKLALLTPLTFQKLDRVIMRAEDELGVILVVTDGRRSWLEQKGIFQQGRTTPGKIVTDAQAGYSWHNFNRGADMYALEPGTRRILYSYPEINGVGLIAEQEGLNWGGSFGDLGHFSNREGTTLAQLRAAYPGWENYQIVDTKAGKLAGFLRKNRKKLAYGAGITLVAFGAIYIINKRRAYV